MGRQIILLIAAASLCPGQVAREPHRFFREHAGLTAAEIAEVESGKPAVRMLPAPSPDMLYVFGAIRIDGPPESYLKFALDINRLRSIPQYLGAGRFSEPPVLADLNGFDLDPRDIKELRNCKPADCELQLPVEAIEGFRRTIDWSKPDVSTNINQRARQMALEALRRYREKGNAALGAYHDRAQPLDIARQFQALLRSPDLRGAYLPDLNRYLLEYPRVAAPPEAKVLFYWERVDFGLKPTLRINHAVMWPAKGPRGAADVIAIKQLYASHYFQVALDLTACVRDGAGFYLISLKGSQQAGLTGAKGALLRRTVVNRTLASQRAALAGIKQQVEGVR